MRIWDVPPEKLCQKHLVAEHGELHSLWSILVNKKKGFSQHPETLRWKGRRRALYHRHQVLVKELLKRGYLHRSPLDIKQAIGKGKQNLFLQNPEEQKQILKKKKCPCFKE